MRARRRTWEGWVERVLEIGRRWVGGGLPAGGVEDRAGAAEEEGGG